MKYQITLKVRGKWEPQPNLIFETWDKAADWAVDNNKSLGYANIEFEIIEKEEETRMNDQELILFLCKLLWDEVSDGDTPSKKDWDDISLELKIRGLNPEEIFPY
jgi:hypothetical protein